MKSRSPLVILTWVVRALITVSSTTSFKNSSARTRRSSRRNPACSVVSVPLANVTSAFSLQQLKPLSKSTGIDFYTSITRARFDELWLDLFAARSSPSRRSSATPRSTRATYTKSPSIVPHVSLVSSSSCPSSSTVRSLTSRLSRMRPSRTVLLSS